MRIVACAAALVLGATAAFAEKLPLNAISNYLNALRTVEAQITQINDDGSISTGKLYIKRPGRMRFEYDPPNDGLVLVENNAVAIFDDKSNQGPETYPLKRTPLSIILANQVNLGQARMVTGHTFDGTSTVVTAQDPENPEYGNIQLKFTDNPIELRQWIVNDANGGKTTVILGEQTTGGTLRNRLFSIDRARPESDR